MICFEGPGRHTAPGTVPHRSGWAQPDPPGNTAAAALAPASAPRTLGLLPGQAGGSGSFRAFDAIYVAKCKLPYFKALN